jgi:hypothetical protein
MLFPGTNLEGNFAFFGGFGLAIAAGYYAGVDAEGPLTIVGGALVVALHSILALRPEPAGSTEPTEGPKILFMPAWWLGAGWAALGVFYTVVQ